MVPPFPQGDDIAKDIDTMSPRLFEYVKKIETTHICACPSDKSEEEKEQCFEQSIELK
jgi:hypothetical protein